MIHVIEFSHTTSPTHSSHCKGINTQKTILFLVCDLSVIVLIKHGSNICFFLSQCWSQANNRTQKMRKNTVTTAVRCMWRTQAGGHIPRTSWWGRRRRAPWDHRGGRRVWDHCFRAKPSRGHRGTDLETGPQKWDGDCQTEAGLGLKKLGVSREQRPKERKNLVLGVWVDRIQEGSQQFSSFKFKVYALTLLPTASAESHNSCTGRSPLDCDKPSN